MTKITREELEKLNELRKEAAQAHYTAVSKRQPKDTPWSRLAEFEKMLREKYGYDSMKHTIDAQSLEIVLLQEKVS